jgi:hypothetical protein
MSAVEAKTEGAMRAAELITRRINRAIPTMLANEAPAKIVALTRCLRETVNLAPEEQRQSLIQLMLECLGLDEIFEGEG